MTDGPGPGGALRSAGDPAHNLDRCGPYLAELRERFPRFEVIKKAHSPFCRLLDVLLRVVTVFGQSAFMTRYVTTLGQRVYVPTGWDDRPDDDRYITLRHEAVHLAQFRRYGSALMTIVYLLPILPLGLALGRARLELEAYAETLRVTAEVRGMGAARALKPALVQQFVGPAYGWMWPFPGQVGRWIDGVLAEISVERSQASV